MVLAGVAAPSFASDINREHLSQCKSELKKVYGEESRLKLKSIQRKRNSQGDHLRIQAVADGESYMTTCWVDREGRAHVMDKTGVALNQAVEYEGGDQVSLAE